MSSESQNTQQSAKRRISVIAPMLITILAGIGVFIVFQFGSTLRSDPLHTDLTASPAYAKIGFQPSDAQLTDPNSLKWDLVLPPHSGSIIMSDLPEPKNYARYGMFSTANREIKEFTILIPFTLDKKALQHFNGLEPVYPILYLAGIGENWEIFLNGHSVADQIFLDGSGRIDEFRNVHDISIPVNKDYLNEGENFLVFHILGAYSSKWTGLRYASPYYLGNSSYTFSGFRGISNIVMCAIFLFIGLYHLLIYAFRRTDRSNLLFSGFTVMAAAYYFAETQILYSIAPNTEYGQRLDYGFMYLLIFIAVAFLETIIVGKITKVTTVYGVFGAALFVIQWFFPIWFAYGLVSVWRYVTIPYVAYAVVFVLLRKLYTNVVNQDQDDDTLPRPGLWRRIRLYLVKTEFGNIYIMLMIVGLTAIIDIINIALFNVNFPLKNYSLLGFMISMAFILARKHPAYEMAGKLDIAEKLAEFGLSPREKEVAGYLLRGLSVRQIAGVLGVRETTARGYVKTLYRKVGINSRPELFAKFGVDVGEKHLEQET